MAKRRTGHPSDFTRDQNRALRELLLRVYEAFPSQEALGQALGIKQQSAGRLLRLKENGFSYATAFRVARLGGFAGVDEFFASRGLGTVVPHARAS